MLQRLARFGYLSVGIVYVLAGLLAAAAARGLGGSTGGQKGAFRFLLHQPFGRAMLFVLAIGLAGYALYRFAAAFADAEHRGDDAKGLALRAGSAGRGAIYSWFAVEVVRLALRGGGDSSGSGDQQTRHWTARAMDVPFGRWLVGIAGLVVIGYAIYQIAKAIRGKLSKQLRLGELDARVRRKVAAISRFGIGARGIVFLVAGGSLVRAALHHNPHAAKGTSGALQQLAQPFGGWPLVLVGFGLVAFGVYSFVNAAYRRL
jgi:hypothetical protein